MVIVYRALHGTAPRYLSDTLSRVADISSRSRLRPSTSSQLMVRPSRLITVGERSLTSAGLRLCSSLPDNIAAASSLSDFRRKRKTHLFGNHTRTLSGSFLAAVDLEVVSYGTFVSDIAILVVKRDVKLQLVSWSLTSLFSTNMAISETINSN